MRHMELNSDIKIVKRNPNNPIWFIWFKVLFKQANPENVYMAFGRIIITPNGIISEDLKIHETKHLEQQKYSYLYAILWYIKYIISPKFRLSQEIPAYGEQIKFLSSSNNKIEVQALIRWTVKSLQNMYKINMTYDELYNKLEEYIYKN